MHPIEGLLGTSLEKIREMTDANTVIGNPIKVSDEVTLIPVSKISFGFASGGSDFPNKSEKELFGGGSGGGISINPIAFIVINNGAVKVMQIPSSDNAAEKAINMVPEVIDKITELFGKKENKENKE